MDTVRIAEDELVHWLENVSGVSNAAEMLRQPTPSFIQTVITAIMTDMQLNVEAMRVPTWSAAQLLQWPEHYENVLPIVVYFSYARQTVEHAGITDFSIIDMIEPKPKRTKKLIYYLVALWKHVLTKYQKYSDVKNNLDIVCEDKEALQRRFLENKEKLLEIPTISAEDHEEALLGKKDMEKQFAEMNKEKEEATERYQATKVAIADVQSKISELDVNIISLKERLDELSSGILKSPNRLALEVESIQKRLEEESNKLLDLIKEHNESEQKKKIIGLQTEGVGEVVAQKNEILSAGQSIRTSAAHLDERKNVFNAKLEEEKKCKAVIESSNNEVALLEQRIVQRKLQHKSEIDELNNLHHMFDENIEKNLKSLMSTKEGVQMLQQEKESLSEDINQQLNKMKEIGSSAVVSISEMLKSFDNFVIHNEDEVKNSKKNLEKFLADCDTLLP